MWVYHNIISSNALVRYCKFWFERQLILLIYSDTSWHVLILLKLLLPLSTEYIQNSNIDVTEMSRIRKRPNIFSYFTQKTCSNINLDDTSEAKDFNQFSRITHPIEMCLCHKRNPTSSLGWSLKVEINIKYFFISLATLICSCRYTNTI